MRYDTDHRGQQEYGTRPDDQSGQDYEAGQDNRAEDYQAEDYQAEDYRGEPEPVGEAAPEPVGEAAPEPVGEAAPEPVAATAPVPTSPASTDETATLWPEETVQDIQQRFREVQWRFVDDPRAAADEAHAVVTEALEQFSSTIESRKRELDGWRDADGGDTEQMRMVVRRYRNLLDRLLGV